VGIKHALNTSLFANRASRKIGTTVNIEYTFYALLESSIASRSTGSSAVVIKHAFYARVVGQRASRGIGRAVSISVTGSRLDAQGVVAALSSVGFTSSPVGKRAVSRGGTFDTATSFQVAVREALILTIVVGGTEGHTSVSKRIAVRLVRDFTTIRSTAGVSVDGAIVATSVGTAVRSGGRAIGINLATNTGTRGNIASRLVRGLSSVQSTALGIRSTSEARTIGLTIVLSSVLGTTGVIVSVSLTDVRVDATSIRANGVGSHGERSIVGNTVSV
jgi:hypothetical protein